MAKNEHHKECELCFKDITYKKPNGKFCDDCKILVRTITQHIVGSAQSFKRAYRHLKIGISIRVVRRKKSNE